MILKKVIALTLLCAALVACDDGPPCEYEKNCATVGACTQEFCDQIFIPSGEFTMGSTSPAESAPPHQVSLDGFFIDKYEVTYERYNECVKAGCCNPCGGEWDDQGPATGNSLVISHYRGECGSDGDKCPHNAVNCRSWASAKEYCEWIGRRLCTEAEWERAANGPGPEQIPFPWGDNPGDSQYENCMWSDSSDGFYVDSVDAHPLGASPEGVFGLAGNVYEWVSDYYAPYSISADGGVEENPAGPAQGEKRVARGGCFFAPASTNTFRQSLDEDFDWG